MQRSRSKEHDDNRLNHYGSKDSKEYTGNAYIDGLEQNNSHEGNEKLLHISALPDDIDMDMGSNSQSPFSNAITKYIKAKGNKFIGKKKSKLFQAYYLSLFSRFQLETL
jgi:hypothetical protein